MPRTISIIVAAAENGVIGTTQKNVDVWVLPKDFEYFKAKTLHKPVIMGRKTLEGMGRPLADRLNIVVTRDRNYQADGCIVAGSIEEALEAAGSAEEIMIMGGGEIYKQALPFVDRVYLTRVHANPPGDVYFNFDETGWKEVSRESHRADAENNQDFDFIVYERIKD